MTRSLFIAIVMSILSVLLLNLGCEVQGDIDIRDSGPDSDADGDSESDTGDGGIVCVPNARQGCGADSDIHWFDSCEIEGPIAVDCPQHAACAEPSDTDTGEDTDTGVECRCLNRWQGETCDVCPEGWDPDKECNFCINGWDPDNGCTECLIGWSGDDCEVCRFYVNAASTASTPDGLSWAKAFKKPQQGIDAAAAAAEAAGGLSTCEVWVAAGVYYIYETKPEDTLQLKPQVAVYGGFNGDETAIVESSWDENPTILSGHQSQGSSTVVYWVVNGSDNAVMSGFIITGGDANATPMQSVGGGIFNNAASPKVVNCAITGNSAQYGAGMYNQDSSPEVLSCIFTGNAASNSGGGMYNKNSSPVVTNTVFAGNKAVLGGGMYNEGSGSPVVKNCVFAGNAATSSGGGVYNKTSTSVQIANSTFRGNSAGSSGVGVRNMESTVAIANSILWDDNVVSDTSSTCSVAYSDVQGVSGTGNINLDPGFKVVLSGSGTWDTDPYYNSSEFRTELTNNGSSWAQDQFAGFFVIFTAIDQGFPVLGNTSNTIYVLGDITALAPNNSDYSLIDLHLGSSSPCIDAADGDAAESDDIDGNPRKDVSSKTNTGTGDPAYVDMGAYEYQGT